jgi:hypothetical protein
MATTKPAWRTAQLAGLLTALAFAISGCLDVRSTLDVRADSTVSGELLLLAKKADLEKQGDVAGTFATWRDQVPDLPPGTESVYDQDGMYGTRLGFDDVSFEEFNQGKALRLRREGDRVVFSLSLDPAGYVRPDRTLKDTAALLETMRFDIKVTLPGTVDRHNGTLSGRTVSWRLGKGTKAAELRAESVVPTPSPTPAPTTTPTSTRSAPDSAAVRVPWQLAGGAVLVAAGLVLGVLAWRRRGST